MNNLQEGKVKMTNYRWVITAMLFFATTINYLDRQVLSLNMERFYCLSFTGQTMIMAQ